MIDFFDLPIESISWLKLLMLPILLFAFFLSVKRAWQRVPDAQNKRRVTLLLLNLSVLISLLGLVYSPRYLSSQSNTITLVTQTGNDGELVQEYSDSAHTFYYHELDGSVSANNQRDPEESSVLLDRVSRESASRESAMLKATRHNLTYPQQLLWRYPQTNRLQVSGDGLYQKQWQGFENIAIDYRVPNLISGLIEIDWPRELNLGEYLNVKGRVQTIKSGVLTLRLLDPAGDTVDSKSLRADEYFKLTAKPKVGGLQEYHLQLLDEQQQLLAEEAIHFVVGDEQGVNILVIQSAPSFEIKHLQNWVAEHRGKMLVKTQISRGRFSTRQTNLPQLKDSAIDETLLSQFDLLIIDGRSLVSGDSLKNIAGLNASQRAAIENAISDGLGVLVLADQSLMAKTDGKTGEQLTELQKVTGVDWLNHFGLQRLQENGDLILAWSDNSDGYFAPSEQFQPTIAAEFYVSEQSNQALMSTGIENVTKRQETLVQSINGIPLVVKQRYGLGQVAVSLLRETHRWVTSGERGIHSHYWQNLIHRLARPQQTQLALDWQPNQLNFARRVSEVCITSTEEIASLNLQSLQNAELNQQVNLQVRSNVLNRYCGYINPVSAGWYQLTQNQSVGEPLWIYIESAASWPAICQQQKIQATLAQQKRNSLKTIENPMAYRAISPWLFWWLFVISAGLIWLEIKIWRSH